MASLAQEEQLEVTNEVRAILHLLVKQHVKSWYTSLSQDEQLFKEFETLSSHVQTTLLGRIEVVDWEAYISGTLSELLLRHLEDFNIAAERTRCDLSLEQAFLVLQTHQGNKDQASYLMHVADALLIVLLPEDDLMSEVAYSITREVLSDLVFRTVVDRLSEPWFWNELLLKLCRQVEAVVAEVKSDTQSRLGSMFGAIKQSMLHSFSQWKSKSIFIKRTQSTTGKESWTFLKHPLGHIRFFHEHVKKRPSIYDTAMPAILHQLMMPSQWPFFKMVWSMVLLPLLDILVGEEINKRISQRIVSAISHNSLAQMLRLARHVLFPNDQPSPARIVPSCSEQLELHNQLLAALPDGMDIPFFQSKVINKVLLFRILDSLLGTIFPELQKRSPEQLKEKLIRIRQANFEAEGSGGIRTGTLHSRPVSIHSPLSMSLSI